MTIEQEAEIIELKRQLGWALRNNRQRNIELDALYYVWCSGGCTGGTLRFGAGHRGPITEDVVQAAERNTRRLREWWENRKARDRNGQ